MVTESLNNIHAEFPFKTSHFSNIIVNTLTLAMSKDTNNKEKVIHD